MPDSITVPRLSTRAFISDVTDELFSIDRGVPYTLWQLLRRPGPTIRRYVVERDPRLTKPFRLVLICLTVLALALHLAGISTSFEAGVQQGYADAGNDSKAFRASLETFIGHLDLMLILSWVPAIAAGVQRSYRRRDLNYAEAFVFGLYTLPQVLVWLQLPLWLWVVSGITHWILWLPSMLAPVAWSASGYFRADHEPLWRSGVCVLLSGLSLVIMLLGIAMGLLVWNMLVG